MPKSASALVFILAAGIATTITAGNVGEARREDSALAQLEAQTLEISHDAIPRLETALEAAESASAVVTERLTTPDEFETVWATVAPVLPGSSLIALSVAVPPADLSAFTDAEAALNPGGELRFVNDDPPGIGHLLLIRTSDPNLPVGVDLSSIGPAREGLTSVGIGTSRFSGKDVRSAGPDVPGQLQIVRRTTLAGPDDREWDAWTTTQIDLDAVLGPLLDDLDDPYGATLSVSGRPAITAGLDEANDRHVTEVTQPLGQRDLSLTVTGWTDGSAATGATRRATTAVGAGITLGLMTMTALGFGLSSMRRRLGQSNRTARQDHLTGLWNRRWLSEHLEAHRGEAMAVLFCDLDRFKVINDSAGHAAGDDLLVAVGQRIFGVLEPEQECARFGGDEFVIVCLAGADSPTDVGTDAARRLAEAMAEPFHVADAKLRTTLSIGISVAEAGTPMSGAELIRGADVALGDCKQAGRNTWRLYDEAFRDADRDRLGLEVELQRALDEGDLDVHYQPIVDVHGHAVSFESLVRWRRPTGEVVSPADFLPIVDEIGRMRDLGAIVLRRAIGDFARFAEGDDRLSLHVNVEPTQLTDRTFPDLVADALAQHDLAPNRLILELVENEWLDLLDEAQPTIDRLAALGVGLSIDDFGSGYSSVARILELDGLVEIKVDRSLASKATDPRSEALIAGIADMGRRLGVAITAEGVETEDELAALVRAGITQFQGFLFARPGPALEAPPARASQIRAA